MYSFLLEFFILRSDLESSMLFHVSIVHSFLSLSCIPLHRYITIRLFHLLDDGHLGYFQFGLLTNKLVKNLHA